MYLSPPQGALSTKWELQEWEKWALVDVRWATQVEKQSAGLRTIDGMAGTQGHMGGDSGLFMLYFCHIFILLL